MRSTHTLRLLGGAGVLRGAEGGRRGRRDRGRTAQLDDASFEAAWNEGVKMSLNEAVALALGEADEADFHDG